MPVPPLSARVLLSACFVPQRKKDSAGDTISLSSYNNNSFVRHQIDKLKFVCALQIVISDFLLKANNSVFFVKAYI